MLTRRARRALVFGVLALLVLASGTVMTASSTRRADATCIGTGSPKIQSRFSGGTLVAQEQIAYPFTTCNGDSQYSGVLLDPITDGSCAYAYYAEPPVYLAQQAVSCTTGGWAAYGYTDTIGSNSVRVSLRTTYLGDKWEDSWGY